MLNLPFLSLAFGLTTALTMGLFYRAAHHSRTTLLVLLGWLLVQGVLALSGFYTNSVGFPPRLALLLGPPMVLILILFFTATGRRYLDGLRLDRLTLLHIVRIPVELVLFGLFLQRAIPELMTFEGRNFDILAGLTAPLIHYVAFRKKLPGSNVLLLWNFVALGLLFNIIFNAVLAAPTSFQRFAFEQPNVAILYFPFNWLPAVVVPLVLLAHLAAIRQLLTRKSIQVLRPLGLLMSNPKNGV